MSEVSGMNASPATAPKFGGGTKPRLSLLSSKQSGICLNSDDQLDQHITVLSGRPDDYANIVNLNSSLSKNFANVAPSTETTNLSTTQRNFNQVSGNEEGAQELDCEENQHEVKKMNLSKEDLIRLIHLLKHDLQSKEIALAAIKCEQLKRLINPVEISRSSLANTYIELQDRLKARDQNNNTSNKTGALSSSALDETKTNQDLKGDSSLLHEAEGDNDESDIESLNILNTLLELLDRHPLLALPRDSIYCLDYNCNEISTKNYLNLKIQHLDNLISQHRRYRFCMNERLRRSEKRCIDIIRELELERSLKYENERNHFRNNGKSILLKEIEQLKEAMGKEKRDKEAIVMTLLNELLDAREQIEALLKKLACYERSNEKSQRDREEKLTELDNLKRQSKDFQKEKKEISSKVNKLETENISLKLKLDQQEARYAELLKSTSNTRVDTKELNQLSCTNSSPSKLNQATHGLKQASGATTPAVVTRSSISSPGTTKPSPPARTVAATNSTRTILGQSGMISNGENTSSAQSGPQVASSRSTSGVNVSASPRTGTNISKPISGFSGSEPNSTRVSPLSKSTSVTSTNQQTKKNLVTSASVTQVINPYRTNSSNATPSLNKPQVPAKPAQLLDQQRNSLN